MAFDCIGFFILQNFMYFFLNCVITFILTSGLFRNLNFCIFVNLVAQAETNGTVLVLNSNGGPWKPAMLVTTEGEQDELSCFQRDDNTEAWEFCSVNWKNQLHVFGGVNEKRQISRLNGHKLERIGTMPFDHNYGGCSVMANQFIFLCFNYGNPNDYKRCRRSTGPLETFSEIPLASYDHRRTQTGCSDSKFSFISH